MTFKKDLQSDFQKLINFRESVGYAVATYKSSVPPFINFCGERYPNAVSITKEMVDAWIDFHPYNTVNSQAVFISMLRQYTKFINALGKKSYIPDDDYNLHRQRYIPYTFSDEELQKLFESIDSIKPRIHKFRRDIILPVLFRMMYCCGMRPSEPLHLLTEDVDLNMGDIYLRQTKKNKDRHIIMSEDMRQLCIKYDTMVGQRQWFFQRWDGTPFDTKWMTKHFHICWDNSGLVEHGNPRPYDLRHAFASRNLIRWIDEGKDVMALMPYLSTYMGHSELNSTFYYIHLLPNRLLKSTGIDWHQFDGIYGEVPANED